MKLHFHPQPKAGPKPKKKPKPLNLKRKFKTYENSLKCYRNAKSENDIRVYAEGCRQTRLGQRTEAETRLSEILRGMGIKAEPEHIEYIRDPGGHTRGFVINDFFCGKHNLILEADGLIHTRTSRYDAGRDEYFAREGYTTLRFSNRSILTSPETVKARIREIMDRT